MKVLHGAGAGFSETVQAYWAAQPRAVRIFTPALDLLWDNTPDRKTRYPLYHDEAGRVTQIPPPGDGRNAWPVCRALEEGRLHERNYWVGDPGSEMAGCYRVRAYPLPLEGDGVLVAEETERLDSALCQNERLRQIDSQLGEMMEGVADFILNHADPSILRLRLANPDLQPCHKVRQCRRKSCPAHGNDNLRCWEIPDTQCHGPEGLTGLAKIRECNHCEVYKLACGAPLTRVGENFNRLIHFLQLKYEETIEMHRQVQQSEKLAALGEMTMSIAHEIKNPLAVICGRLDCLRLELETLRPADLAEDLEVLASQAARMRHFVEGLLALSRPAEVEHRPLDLNEVIRSTLPLLGKMLEKSGVCVESRLADKLPPVLGDTVSIQQILLNLILNAREAMEEGGTLRITSRVNPEDAGEVMVEVKDSGCGIAARALKKIFQPFYSTRAGHGGTGLGLAICTRIMTQHGGRITARSRVGRGATFVLNFKTSGGNGHEPNPQSTIRNYSGDRNG